ncbi:MAG: redoxin family protein [Lacipirellulaceae bacterium]
MTFRRLLALLLLSPLALLSSPSAYGAGAAPTVAQALTLAPIQAAIDYAKPAPADVAACSIKPEREGKSTSWVVRDAAGAVLRKFADTNADNVVDRWSYYKDGLEVYRDVDSDFDSKADQCRWFHTGGTRWGVDKNQDGKVDRWQQISPHEVAEEAVAAVQTNDFARFARLMLADDEQNTLGLARSLDSQVQKTRATAAADFQELVRSQKSIKSTSRFVDFGAARPGLLPAGIDGATRDAMVYDNASALIDNDGMPEQLLLGALFRVGDAWRLVESPTIGGTGPKISPVQSSVASGGGAAAGNGPSDEQQGWLVEIEKIDLAAAKATGAEAARLTDMRVALLEKLAGAASTADERAQWTTQLADLLTAEAQSRGYAKGLTKLAELERSPAVTELGDELVAHIRYRRIGAEYGLSYSDKKANVSKVQEKWLGDLEQFVKDYPTSPDAAEAMLQLGMSDEFAGEEAEADAWYNRLAAEFPATASGKKATGALRRMNSIGKQVAMRGPTLDGKQLDLAAFRGRHVVIQYWATWCEPCKEDMQTLAALQKKYGAKIGVLGVNLDNSLADAKRFVASVRTPWPHLYDEAGLEGERATDLGVMTLPLMLLVDGEGKVVNRNLYGADLEAELERVIR